METGMDIICIQKWYSGTLCVWLTLKKKDEGYD